MTRYCKQERTKVYNLYLEHFYNPSQNSYRNYARAEQYFKDRFHKRFDPRCLIDEYDIWGITWNRKEGKPFIPTSHSIIWENVNIEYKEKNNYIQLDPI